MARDDIVDMDADEGPTTDPLVTGITVFTFLSLIVAFVVIQKALAEHYANSVLF